MSHRSVLLALTGLVLLLAGMVVFQGMSFPLNDPVEQQILFQLRLPVVLTAFIVGAGLAVSSACLQVLLRNPIADPGIIGITSGASVCAAFFLLLGGDLAFRYLQYGLPLFCFAGALASTFLVYFIARKLPGVHTAVILAGIAISTICGAVIAWLHLFSDAESMRNLTFWLMGSLHQADWPILTFAFPTGLVLCVYLISQGRSLNLFYFGGTEASLAGVDVNRFTRRVLIASALMVGLAVSVAGSIAFVGLLVPHFMRNLFGFNNRFILPASALAGGCLMMLVVLVSDQMGGVTIPVSMLTASIGGPLFLYSIIRLSKRNI